MNIPDLTDQLLPGQRAGRAVRTLACQLRDTLTLDDTCYDTDDDVGQYWSVVVTGQYGIGRPSL